MSTWTGTACGLASAASWACANVAIQYAAWRVGSWSALVWAQVGGSAVAAVAALWLEGPPRMPPTSVWWALVGAGLASALAYGGLFEALARGQVAVVSPIVSAWSAVSVAIGVAQGERLTRLVAIGIALVVCGNILVARATARASAGTSRAAIVAAVCGACGFGVMVPLFDAAADQVGRLWCIPLVWAVELLFVVPWLWKSGRLRRPVGRIELAAVGWAALFEVAGFVALSIGLSRAAVSVVSPVSSLSTMGSVALGVLVLRERVARRAIVGAFAASLGIVLINC